MPISYQLSTTTISYLLSFQLENTSDDQKLEWAMKESLDSEKARQKRLQTQEEMDIAIALKQSVESSSEA